MLKYENILIKILKTIHTLRSEQLIQLFKSILLKTTTIKKYLYTKSKIFFSTGKQKKLQVNYY